VDRQEEQLVGAPGEAHPSRQRRYTRRQVLKYGLAGAVGVAGAVGAGYYVYRASDPRAAEVAEVFKGDAPRGELWEMWKRRGWVQPARYCYDVGRNVQCKVCPNNCLLEPDDRGRCRNKVHKEGRLYTMAYGNPASVNVDPIEKKPLYHFLPTTTAFSLATTGCGFRCLNCQNWDLSQRKPEELKDPRGDEWRMNAAKLDELLSKAAPDLSRSRPDLLDAARNELLHYELERTTMLPQDVVELAGVFGSRSIAYTYSEPTSYFEYMIDTARLARRKGIKNVWITCGYINEEPLTELCQYLDAANVDLKSFSEDSYRTLNSGKLEPILNTLKTLKRCGVWLEVGYLVVPTYTDKREMFQRLCAWLAENVGVDYPLHFLRFHPAHKLRDLPSTPPEALEEARSVAKAAGLRYVYLGNAHQVKDADTTFCPGCGRPVIVRDIFRTLTSDLAAGKCRHCGTPINGVWGA